ncbi:MAG: sugar phosphate isomerase/epimerase, partial [Planctomycetota bacterium]
TLSAVESICVTRCVAVAAETGAAGRKPDGTRLAGLTLGFSTYGMKTLRTEQAIERIADAGFDSVEIAIMKGWDADPETLEPGRRIAIRNRLADRRVFVRSLMEHLHIDEPGRSRQQRLERLKRAAELAHDLDPARPPLVQTTIGGGGHWAEKRDLFAAELEQWVRVAGRHELTIAVKPHRGGAFSRPDQAVELIERLGSPPRLKMCFDYSHYDFRDMPLEEAVRTALPYVGHVAVKDVARDTAGRLRFRLPGETGRIDYPKLLRLLFDGGYRGDVCCEVSSQIWSQPGYDPLAAAETSYRNMARAFERAGVPRLRRTR